jgi:3-hydroxybutyryl-CoA dehydratase
VSATPPRVHDGVPALRFSELARGDELRDAATVTEAHLLLGTAVFNDPGPNHLNQLQAAANRFGERIAPGPLLVGIMCGCLGNVFGSTIVALLEQGARFRRPAFVGDTVLCRWTVAELIPKPRFDGGGIVVLEGEALNQDGLVLAAMEATLAVAERALWEPAAALPDFDPPTTEER